MKVIKYSYIKTITFITTYAFTYGIKYKQNHNIPSVQQGSRSMKGSSLQPSKRIMLAQANHNGTI